MNYSDYSERWKLTVTGCKWLMDRWLVSGKFSERLVTKCTEILIKFKIPQSYFFIKTTPNVNSLHIYREILSSCQNCHNLKQIVFMMFFIVSLEINLETANRMYVYACVCVMVFSSFQLALFMCACLVISRETINSNKEE